MKNETDRVGDVLEVMIKKIEGISRDKNQEFNEYQRILGSMDRLTGAVLHLEQQKRRQRIMTRKVSGIYKRMERISGVESRSVDLKSITFAASRLLNGAKVTGQVIEIVASSLQVLVETVTAAIKSPAGTRAGAPAAENKGLDLNAMFKPINALLNSLITKPHSSAPTPPLSPTPSEESGDAGLEVQMPGRDEHPVPVVKAVPVSDYTSQENK